MTTREKFCDIETTLLDEIIHIKDRIAKNKEIKFDIVEKEVNQLRKKNFLYKYSIYGGITIYTLIAFYKKAKNFQLSTFQIITIRFVLMEYGLIEKDNLYKFAKWMNPQL